MRIILSVIIIVALLTYIFTLLSDVFKKKDTSEMKRIDKVYTEDEIKNEKTSKRRDDSN